jgi:hypothetical protein
MARALVIEEESGTTRATVHPHNGYYAGDFSSPRQAEPTFGTVAVVDLSRTRAEDTTGVRQQLGWAA